MQKVTQQTHTEWYRICLIRGERVYYTTVTFLHGVNEVFFIFLCYKNWGNKSASCGNTGRIAKENTAKWCSDFRSKDMWVNRNCLLVCLWQCCDPIVCNHWKSKGNLRTALCKLQQPCVWHPRQKKFIQKDRHKASDQKKDDKRKNCATKRKNL